MRGTFHEEHDFVLLDPLVNDELCIFFGDFDWLSGFSWVLLAEFEVGGEDEGGIVIDQGSSEEIADHKI